MTYTITISDSETTDVLDMEDVTDVWAWFDAHCRTSERGETITLLKDGVEVQKFVND